MRSAPVGPASTGSLFGPLVSPAMQDLDQVIVYVFYVWIAASLFWMLKTLLSNRRARRRDDELVDADKDDNVDSRPMSALDSEQSDQPESKSKSGADSETAAKTAPNKVETKSAKTESDLVIAEGATTEAATTEAATKKAQRGGAHSVPAPAAEAVTERAVPAGPTTIADLLSGIRLPFDLLPMVPNGEEASDQRVSLVSAEEQPEVLGAAIADELERLGYSIKTLATDQARANRGAQRLALRIFPEAPDLINETGKRFPDAPEGSVAIDLWVDRDAT